MKVLVVTQYFYPEDFKINDLVAGFVSAGHDVTVLTGKPNYPFGKIFSGYCFWGVQHEEYKGAKVIRVPLIPRGKSSSLCLMLNYFSYVFFSCVYVMTHRLQADKIICWDTSPITQAYAGIRVKKQTGASLSIWVQDLWPESVFSTGALQYRWAERLLNRMVRNIYRHMDTIFIQSPAFEQSIREKGAFKARFVYAPNWAEDIFCDSDVVDREKYARQLPGGFRVMFAGNIGVAQDFDSILHAAALTHDDKRIQWLIVGDGRQRSYVERRVEALGLHDTVTLLGRRPLSDMPSLFVHADVMLVALKDEHIFALTIPSKIQAYMLFGKPILTMLSGEGSRTVEEAQCGLTAASGDYARLAQHVQALASNTGGQALAQYGQNGKNYYERHFRKETIINRIITYL